MAKTTWGWSLTGRRERAAQVTAALAQVYPEADCALHHETPFQLLAATILSAQCTDERVNRVTPALFARFPTAAALARAPLAEVERLVQSTGFFRAKAKNLVGMAQRVMDEFGGELPRTVAELVTLPGVGRKTANVLLGTAYGIPSGVVVDTHVGRISRLLGLTRQLDAVKVEQELGELLPAEEWIAFSHRLILHGRAICVAGRPRCGGCPLRASCARVGLPPLDDRGEPVRKPQSARAMKEAAAKRRAARRASRRRPGVPPATASRQPQIENPQAQPPQAQPAGALSVTARPAQSQGTQPRQAGSAIKAPQTPVTRSVVAPPRKPNPSGDAAKSRAAKSGARKSGARKSASRRGGPNRGRGRTGTD